MKRRFKILLLASAAMLVGGVALVIIALTSSGSVPEEKPLRTFGPTPVAPRFVLPTPIPEATVEPTPEPPPPPPPPSDAPVARLIIPTLGVDAPVKRFLLNADGTMPDPKDGATIAWYDLCGEDVPALLDWCLQQPEGHSFSRPGFGGNAVFAAHVYWLNKKAIFIGLSDLKEGDDVQVRLEDDTLYSYRVVSLQVFPPDGSANEVVGPLGRETITLITCYGFNPTTRDYDNRVVIVADRVYDEPEEEPAPEPPPPPEEPAGTGR